MYVIEIGLDRKVMLSDMCERIKYYHDAVTRDTDRAKKFETIAEALDYIKAFPDKILLENCAVTSINTRR